MRHEFSILMQEAVGGVYSHMHVWVVLQIPLQRQSCRNNRNSQTKTIGYQVLSVISIWSSMLKTLQVLSHFKLTTALEFRFRSLKWGTRLRKIGHGPNSQCQSPPQFQHWSLSDFRDHVLKCHLVTILTYDNNNALETAFKKTKRLMLDLTIWLPRVINFQCHG